MIFLGCNWQAYSKSVLFAAALIPKIKNNSYIHQQRQRHSYGCDCDSLWGKSKTNTDKKESWFPAKFDELNICTQCSVGGTCPMETLQTLLFRKARKHILAPSLRQLLCFVKKYKFKKKKKKMFSNWIFLNKKSKKI